MLPQHKDGRGQKEGAGIRRKGRQQQKSGIGGQGRYGGGRMDEEKMMAKGVKSKEKV